MLKAVLDGALPGGVRGDREGRINHAKASIWKDTLPKVMRLCFPEVPLDLNEADLVATFPNGSQVILGGLDDKARVEKILGGEYRALQAAEAAYRVFQFAMSVQAMATGAAETAAHVAQSGTKAAASTAAGAAKMFEQLGPYAFPVVAAMIALLATLGMKGSGGGGSSSSSSVDASVSTSQGYSQQADTVQNSFASSVAQNVEVRVTADRDGLNAYVVRTAQQEAVGVAAPMVAAAAAGTKRDTMQTLKNQQLGNRRATV